MSEKGQNKLPAASCRRAAKNLESVTAVLSGMLKQAVTAEKKGEEGEADLKRMKELTAILKDLTGVVNAWKEPQEQQGETGVVFLPREEGEA